MVKYLVIILFSIGAWAGSHSAGVSISTFSGTGISYSYRISKLYDLNLTGFPIFLQDSEEDQEEMILNFGASLNYNYFRKEKFEFYLSLGASYWYQQRSEIEITIIDLREFRNEVYDINRVFNLGLANGISYKITNNFKLNFELGLQNQLSEAYSTGMLIDRDGNGTNFTGLAGGFSLIYKF